MSDRGYIGMSLNIQAMAINAEIEGMNAENENMLSKDMSIAYVKKDYMDKAQELRVIANEVRELVHR